MGSRASSAAGQDSQGAGLSRHSVPLSNPGTVTSPEDSLQ